MNLSTRLADICDRAAEVIETDGHAKKVCFDVDTGGRCLVGSLGHANLLISREESKLRDFSTSLASVAYQVCAGQGYSIPWNDRPERTKYEVIDGLKHTAKALRNGEITLPATA